MSTTNAPTAQELFDRVARHLLKQGKKSTHIYDSGLIRCAYRGADGTRCAVGCLIDDEHYTPRIEGMGSESLYVNQVLRRQFGAVINFCSRRVLQDLQVTHDATDVPDWPYRLRKVAGRNNLNSSVIDEWESERKLFTK